MITNGSASVISNNLYDLFGVKRYEQGSAETPWRWSQRAEETLLWAQGVTYLPARSPTNLLRKSHILVCRRKIDKMPDIDPALMHYAIAGCGKGIFEGGGTNEEKLYDRPHQWECVILVVTEHEKRCVCSYGAWLEEDWEDHYRYRWFTNNCKHFVLDVLQACLFKPPKDMPALYRLFAKGYCRALW